MEPIIKIVEVFLTQEEIDSPAPITIKLIVRDEDDETITYTINFPKEN